MASTQYEAKNLLSKGLRTLVNSQLKKGIHESDNHDMTLNNSDARLHSQKVKPTDISIRVINTGREVTTQVMTVWASVILEQLWQEDGITPNLALKAYLETIAYFYGKKSLTENNITKELLKKEVKIIFDEVDVSTEEGRERLGEWSNGCELSDRTQLEDIETDRDLLEGLLYTVILLMGKNLVENSVQIWFQKRINSFCAALGRNSIPTIPQPNLQMVKSIYSRISSLHEVRKNIFRIIQKSSSGEDRVSILATIALGLLSYTEMGHVQIIFEYIICNYVEILQARLLQGENTENFLKVLEFISTVPVADRPYIKLLNTSQQTKVMHRDKFPLIIDAAYAVASYVRPTFKNYRGDVSKAIEVEVTKYLTNLATKQADLMLSATFSSMNEIVKKNAAASKSFFQLNTKGITEEPEDERN